MKRITFLILLLILFIFSTHGQTKSKQKPIAKTAPQNNKEVSTQKAVTENGKPVILKSDGTWEFVSVEPVEQPQIKPCNLTLKEAPVIRGLKLRMTRDEVQKAFGVSENDKRSPFYYKGADVQPNGVFHYTFYETTLDKLEGFSGIRVLELDFFNSQLHTIKVKYSENTAKFTDDQFKSKIIEVFNLPIDNWTDSSFYFNNGISYPTGKKLECSGFEIETSFGNTLSLTNLITSKEIENYQKYKRETFKP